MGADAIIAHYRKHAAAWAAARGNRLIEGEWLNRFRALMPSGATVLDLGCGSGEPIARYLEHHGCVVTGIDSSPELVALFRQKLPEAQTHVADMRTLALGQRFDGVLAWDSFFHLSPDDQRAMFAIFAAHAAPGGALMFTSGPSAGEAYGEFCGDPLYHASLDPHEYRALLDTHGFTIISHIAEDRSCGGRTVWLTQARR